MPLKDSLYMTYFSQLDPSSQNFQNFPQITLLSGDLGFCVWAYGDISYLYHNTNDTWYLVL